MLNKKTIKSILLEIEASYYNYEEYLQEVVSEILNNNNSMENFLKHKRK